MGWNEMVDGARKIFSEKTTFEKMVEKSKADFARNNVIARGAQATAKIAEWQRNGWLEPLYKDGRVYINPFTPINDEVFIGKLSMDAVFMKGDMLYRINSSQFDQKISLDAIYTCIRRLRRKLDVEGKPSLITTKHGLGYGFALDETADQI